MYMNIMAHVTKRLSGNKQSLSENLQEYLNQQLEAFVGYQERKRNKTSTTDDRKKKRPGAAPEPRKGKISVKESGANKTSKISATNQSNDTRIQEIFKKYRKTDCKTTAREDKSKSEPSSEETIKAICEKYRTDKRKYSEKVREDALKRAKEREKERSKSLSDKTTKEEKKTSIDDKNRKTRPRSEDLSDRYRGSCSFLESTTELLRSIKTGQSSPRQSPRKLSSSLSTYPRASSKARKFESKFMSSKFKTKATDSPKKSLKILPKCENKMEKKEKKTYTSYLSVGSIGDTSPKEVFIDENIDETSPYINTEKRVKNINSDLDKKKQTQNRLKENGRRHLECNGIHNSKQNCNILENKNNRIHLNGGTDNACRSRDITHDATEKSSKVQNGDCQESDKKSIKEKYNRSVSFLGDDELTTTIQEDLERWRGRRRERMKERPSYVRSRSEGACNSKVSNRMMEILVSKETSIQDADLEKEYQNEAEIDLDLRKLLEKLRQCTDFTERRKIRGVIRKLREKKSALEITSGSGNGSGSSTGSHNSTVNSGEVSPVVKDAELDLTQTEDIAQLRRLLSETSDYDEKKKIRLALRQLRQRDKERENGRDGGIVNGRGLGRSHSFASPHGSSSKNGEVIRESGDRPTVVRSSSLLESKTRRKSEETPEKSLTKDTRSGSDNVTLVEQKRAFVNTTKPQESRSVETSKTNGSDVHSISESSKKVTSENCADLKPPFVPNGIRRTSLDRERPSSNQKDNSASSKRHSLADSHSNIHPLSFSSSRLTRRLSTTDTPDPDLCQKTSPHSAPSNSPRDSSRRSKSVVEATAGPVPKGDNVRETQSGSDQDHEILAKKWLEGKKRSCSLPGADKSLKSTDDMEAAFSELLNAVDDKADDVSDTEPADMELIAEDSEDKSRTDSVTSLSEADIKPEESAPTQESASTAKIATPEPSPETERVDHGIICTSPPRSVDRPRLDVGATPPDNTSAISVIEDDDGSVTVQSTTHSDLGDHTVTEKLRLRRTESRTEEEEKDTIIESRITSPGGSDHYSKDVIKTRRKVTSRGSDYFTRSAYNIRKRKDFEGDEIEEQDISVETDNFSVTKGESWGDRAEAKVQVVRLANSFPSSIPEGREVSAEALPEVDAKSLSNGNALGRMDVSKTSSGYGSVSGSDEEEKEEVTSARKGRQGGCPEIKSTLKDVITLEGSTAVLECTVSGSPLPTITWYNGNKPVEPSRHYEPKFDTLTGKASLTVLNTRADNGGEYRCVFTNPLGEAETKSRLTVRSKALKKPSFTSPLKDTTVTEGQAVELECKVTDATQISWYKDGIIQRNSSDFKQTFDGSFAKLEIGEIFLDDTGEYSCVAKNEKGEAKTVCKIKVKEGSGDGVVVPMFLTKPESKIYSSGDPIILECDVIGSPQPTVTWYRDRVKLTNTGKHRSFYDGRMATLTISQTTPEDSGKYEITAESTSGKVSVDALIVIKEKQGPPAILHSLADATATVGKPLILHCDIRGSPVPMILWRKDGKMIGNTADFRQTYENNIAKLAIKDVYEQDGGCYECVARNSFGAVSSSCTITVEGKKAPGKATTKKTDWLVGRDKSSPEDAILKSNEVTKLKGAGVRRSESVRVTSTFPARDRFRQEPKTQEDNTGATTTHAPKHDASNTSSTLQSSSVDARQKESNKTTSSAPEETKPAKATGKEDPPWKNVTLRRTESARMPNYGRSKPLSWKRGEEIESKDSESKDTSVTSENRPDTPPGWRPVSLDVNSDTQKPQTEVERLKVNSGLRRSESARTLGSNRDIVAKFILGAQQREKDSMSDKNDITSGVGKSPSVREISRLKDEECVGLRSSGSRTESLKTEENNNEKKLGRSQSMRLLFERQGGTPAQNEVTKKEEKEETVPSYLARRDVGVRRTSSLKITQKEAGALRSKRQENGVYLDLAPVGKEADDSVSSRRRVWENGPSADMSSYETIDDEEELHKMLSKTDNFEERKKIRSRMKEIREKKQQEWEQKRIQREKETEDIVKRKYQIAEEEKQRKMKEFDKMAKEASKERERIHGKQEELLKDKIRQADLDKKRHLETFDKLAKHDDVKKTVQTTPGGGTRTIVVKDSQTTSGFGGISYGKSTTEQAANFLTNQLIGAVAPGTSGKITVKTESWSSKDGITNKSEKSETWGAKPQGPQGAKAMFKQMDASSPAPKANFAAGGGGGGGRALMRSPSAIKQMLLEWTKAMTKEYQEYGVEVTNFSTSWNNGMAFCALIHHFYPESFDFSALDPKKRRANFTLAFDTAEKFADIAPLLDVEDMVKMQKPDWKCVFTYVQSFYRKLHTHERNAVAKQVET